MPITDFRKLQQERPKTIMIDNSKQWCDLPKEEKIFKIKLYMKKYSIKGALNQYKFSDIKYNRHLEQITTLKAEPRNPQ